MTEQPDETQVHAVLSEGTAVAKYRIVRRIGSGGMGEVYLAQDTHLARNVALKFLPAALSHDAQVRSRFVREARAAAGLDHPNIVTVHEVGEHQGRPYFAMQFVDGHTLQHYCREELLSSDQILELAVQVADGLAKAHAAGVTHRDIKSANIILDQDRRPKIVDFGLAAVEGGEMLTQAGTTLGTAAYMSPEQARGGETDHRSDIFSLGAVLYELVSGRTPFQRESVPAVLHSVIHDQPEPLTRYKTDVPDDLQRIVSRCLAKDPGERYQSAADLAADLRMAARLSVSGLQPAASSSRPSVAVLPFANLSTDPENEYFADGLTEELLNVLSKNGGLKVTGRTSSFAFKGKQEDLRDIGKKLGVKTLLEGSVRKAGNRVRITTQLVNAEDGFHLWSETYDRVLEDIFAVQDEIAAAVAEAMNVALLGQSQSERVSDPESYALTLRAQQAALQMTKSSVDVAVDLFQKALELDADNARAWAGLGRAFGMQMAYGYAANTETGWVRAREATARALELDASLPEAHEANGWVGTLYGHRFGESLEDLRRAHELAPNNSRIACLLGLLCGITENFDESLRYVRLAVELDPLNAETHLHYSRACQWAGHWDEAEAPARRALELSPGITTGYLNLAHVRINQNRLDEALKFVEQEEATGFRTFGRALVYYLQGREEESETARKALEDLGDGWDFQLAAIHAIRGESDQAFHLLEAAAATKDAGIMSIRVAFTLNNLHGDPRWPVFLAKIGLGD